MPGNQLSQLDSTAACKLPDTVDFSAWVDDCQSEFLLFRVNASDRIEFISPSVQSILGRPPKDFIGRDYRKCFDLRHPLCEAA